MANKSAPLFTSQQLPAGQEVDRKKSQVDLEKRRDFIRRADEIFDPNEAARGDSYVKRAQSGSEESIDNWVESALNTPSQQIFLTGDSGVGKTNLLLYWADVLGYRAKICDVSEDRTLAEIVETEIHKLNEQTSVVTQVSETATGRKQTTLSGKYLSRSKDQGRQTQLTSTPVIEELGDRLAEAMYKKGLHLIIFDNLQNLRKEDLASLGGLMERFADQKNIHTADLEHWNFYPKIAAAGVSMHAEDLIASNPSRVRRIVSRRVEHMSMAETAEIAKRGFGELGVDVEEEALSIISYFSDGFPFFVKQICAAAAKQWADTESQKVTAEEVRSGVDRMTYYFDDASESQLKLARGSKRTGIRPRVLQVIAESEKHSWSSGDVLEEWRAEWEPTSKSPIGLELNKLATYGVLVKTPINQKSFEYSFRNPRLRPYIRMNPVAD